MKTLLDKLVARGSEALSDGELLTLVLGDRSGSPNGSELSGRILAHYGQSLARLGRDDPARLRMVEGIGLHRAVRIVAAMEIGRRILQAEAHETTSIATSEDVVRIFRPELESLRYEECWIVYLTSSNRILERQRISQGGIQGTVVDHRLIIKRALELLATQMIMVHNHPSGTAEASSQDKTLTRKIAEAAALFDIRLLDHIIIAATGEYSFRSAGLLP